MKVGLITYHYSQNYGAVMQTYATCRILKELGHDVEIINIRQLEKRKLRHVVFIPKYRKFDSFINKYYSHQTSIIHNMQELRSRSFNYNCLLVGSDQVWNPMISLDRCMAYFLDFGNPNMKRISYASSLGISQWPTEKKYLLKDISRALYNFDAISVREKTGQRLLKEIFNLDAQLVVDPTMLHSGYDEIVSDVSQTNNIVCYLLNRTGEQLKASRFIAKQLNEKAQLLTSVYPVCGFEYVYPPSIEEWIKYIAGASLVITDSFHGVVFSLLYKRNFVVFAVNNGKNSRLMDLLELVGLKNRYFTSFEELNKSNIYNYDVDYSQVTPIIERERESSTAYLINSLAQH
jgi:hypothetical protein